MRKRLRLTKKKFLIKAIIGSAIAVTIGGLFIWAPAWTGFGPDSTKNIERDAANRIIKTVEIGQSAKTLWDWLSLLGVPASLVGLGFWFQQLQQKKLDEEAKEDVLQNYFDRLSTLLIDEDLIAIAKSLVGVQITQADKELLEAAKGIIKARTISVLRRLGNDRERKFDVIQFLIETEVFSTLGLDTSRLDLQSFDLEGINLQKANLKGANFEKMNLKGANFRGANLTNANLSGADLTQANLDNADLTRANLSGATLVGATLKGTKLCRAVLRNADLTKADLFKFNWNFENDFLVKGTDLFGADLSGADLREADLRWVDLQGAILSQAKLQGARISGIHKWDSGMFEEYSYESKTLVPANLGNAVLCNTVLTAIDFEGVNLEGSNLTGADLTRANLSAAQGVTEEQLNQAKLCQTKLPDHIRLDANRDCGLK